MDRRTFLKITAVGALAGSIQGLPGPLSALAGSGSGSDAAIRYDVADSHFHYVDFLQKTEGVDALLQSMDQAGVAHVMFSGMPLVKKWDAVEPVEPGYYLDDNARTYWYSATDFIVARRCRELPDQARHRFHPFICGFNATDKHAVLHVERMIEEYPGLWQGIGEVFGHRDDLTNLTYGETPHLRLRGAGSPDPASQDRDHLGPCRAVADAGPGAGSLYRTVEGDALQA